MLYLEDYLEMIEHLPAELRDRFTDIREMDLSVQNQIDRLEEREATFFADCSKKLKPEDKEAEFAKIKEEYKKVIEDAGEKVQVAEECYGLVDRYLRKLDDELHKFKMELEADNRGITEILEKQSLEMDAAPSVSHLKENRLPSKKVAKKNTPNVPKDKRSLNFPLSDMILAMDSAATSYPIQHMGPGGNAIAQAASQAIAATQQLSGRRTSSLKASLEAINLGAHDFPFGRDFGTATAGAPSTASSSSSSQVNFATDASLEGPVPKKKKNTKASEQVLDVVSGGSLLGDSFLDASMGTDLLSSDLRDQDWNFDPNEPRYCICNQVSYGDMVACDNEDCPYEWFHYPCVGITAPPKGKWYCPKCQANMARRKRE